MDEKKNFTPNAIADDELNEVAGGAFFAGNFGSAINESGMFNSGSNQERHYCNYCHADLAAEDVYYLANTMKRYKVCKSCYDQYPLLQVPR